MNCKPLQSLQVSALEGLRVERLSYSACAKRYTCQYPYFQGQCNTRALFQMWVDPDPHSDLTLLQGAHASNSATHDRVTMRLPRSRTAQQMPFRIRPVQSLATSADQSQAYNEEMKKAMGWDDADPYQYHYDRGLYYHEVMPDLLCGSQPRNVEDIVKLKEDIGATVIINVSASCRTLKVLLGFGHVVCC